MTHAQVRSLSCHAKVRRVYAATRGLGSEHDSWGGSFGRLVSGLLLCGSVSLTSCSSVLMPSLQANPNMHRTAPRGYVAFCARDPTFCQGTGAHSVRLTARGWRELLQINDRINATLTLLNDHTSVAVSDDWVVPTSPRPGADCKHYVLAKKAELVALGWPKPALRIGLVEGFGGFSRHAVLLVDTDQGVFVLDNVTRKVLPWSEADYRWISVQVSTDPDRWQGVTRVRIGDSRL